MVGSGAAGASYGELLMTSLAALGAVCVAAFLVVRWLGRWGWAGRGRGGDMMGVVARLALEPRRSLYVVEVAGKTLLVGTSEMGLSVLSELDGDAVKAQARERQGFGDLVRTALARRRAGTADEGAVARAGGARAGHDVERDGEARDGERRDMAHDGERRDMARDGERRDMPRDEERRDMTHDGARRDMAHDGERRDMARDGERRDMTRDGEAQDDERDGGGAR